MSRNTASGKALAAFRQVSHVLMPYIVVDMTGSKLAICICWGCIRPEEQSQQSTSGGFRAFGAARDRIVELDG